MTQEQRDIAAQVAKARSWLRVARDLKSAAQARLRAGAGYPELYNLRRDVAAAERQAADAYEDLVGWQRLAARFR
jgi:hypothetical protein